MPAALAQRQVPRVPEKSRAPAEVSPLGLFLDGPDGFFIAYQSALPAIDAGEDAGFVGYYSENATRRIFVFSQLIFDDADVTAALIELGWQFETTPDAFHPRGTVIPYHLGVQSVNPRRNHGVWVGVTEAEVFAVMGFAEAARTASDAPILQAAGGIAAGCPPSTTHATAPTLDSPGRHLMPAPPPIPADALTGALLVVGCGGGGGPAPTGCVCCAVFREPSAGVDTTPCCQLGCNDGNPCTENDKCVGAGPSGCQGTIIDCRDPNPCKTGFCENGACKTNNRTDNSPCPDDGNLCTLDVCQGGTCSHPPKCPGQACCGGGCCDKCCDPMVASCCNGGTCCGDLSCCPSADECCPSDPTGCCPLTAECCTDGCGECCDLANGGGGCTTDCCGLTNLCCPSATPTCCGGDTCCAADRCCGGVTCCAQPCEGCVSSGALSGGAVEVVPPVVCLGDTITFTATGVTDGGNPQERVMCSTIQPIPLGGVTYDWTLTVPPGYSAPLPPLTGSGASVTVAAKIPGSYTASFNAKPTRTKCPPVATALGGSKSVVAPSATLSISPVIIPANTPWTGMPLAVSQAAVTVMWNPPNCVGTLEIAEIVGTGGYVPPSDATLAKDTDTHWVYTAYGEPQSEHCSNNAQVWIAAVKQSVEVSRRSLTVVPVHFWLTQTAQRDFVKDFNFVFWKYASVIATTGAAVGSVGVTVSSNTCIKCPPLIGPCVAAWTSPAPLSNITFGTNAFASSENQAASIIGHEFVHTTGGDECTAYTWEFNHDAATGIFNCDSTYLADVVRMMNCKCSGIMCVP